MRTSVVPFLACLLVWSLPAEPASLRSATTLQQAQVRISDLFDDAGPGADRVLGTGPLPGGRIVVEAAQAAAIARQFGVAWRPASGSERVVIDRPGRMPGRDEIIDVLRTALLGAGASLGAGVDVDLSNFVPPLVAVESVPHYSVEQVDFEPGSGRFTATLAISAEAEPMQRMRVSGTVADMVDIVVPVRRLPVGTVITAEDLQTLRVRASPSGAASGAVHGEVARSAEQAVGKAIRRLAVAGVPIRLADLGRPLAVLKGARVMLLLDEPGLSLAAIGIANEAGGIGDEIAVLNPGSGTTVAGEVIAADQVRVRPNGGALLAGRGALQVSAR